jgi:hypothetical protein
MLRECLGETRKSIEQELAEQAKKQQLQIKTGVKPCFFIALI